MIRMLDERGKEKEKEKESEDYCDGDSTLEQKNKEEGMIHYDSKQNHNGIINGKGNENGDSNNNVNTSITPLQNNINSNKECLFQCFIKPEKDDFNDNNNQKKHSRKKNVKINEPFIDEVLISSYKKYNLKMTYIQYNEDPPEDIIGNRLWCKCKSCTII